MAGKPAEPRRDEHALLGARVGVDAPAGEGEPERTGPLTIERLRKADGRALILYAEDSAAQGRS
jgi:hypothetical protein